MDFNNNLINNFWSTGKYWLKLYQLLRAVAVIVADGVCKIMWKSVENWLRYQRKSGKNDQKNAQRSVKTHYIQ